MVQFSKNLERFDPYKNYKFRIQFEGKDVAGISKVSALKRTTEVIEHREGGDPSSSRKSPSGNKFEAITLERGVTHDPEFENWANRVWTYGSLPGSEMALKNFRKELRLVVYNEAGQEAMAYLIHRCWVSEYQALSDFDSNSNAILIEQIKIECEGWERDTGTTEPSEPDEI